MKTTSRIFGCVLGAVLAGSAWSMPDNEYACKVQTIGIKLGVVFVQADTKAIAAEMASGAPAITGDGKSEQAQSTLECIELPGESFQDRDFDLFVRSLPR